MRRDKPFRVRLSAEEVEQLHVLATTSDRTCSDVLRLLLRQAQATGQAEILLRPDRNAAQGVRR